MRMRAIPLRLRLALIYLAAMAVVFTVVGGFLYVKTRSTLDAGIDSSLALRAQNLSTAIAAGASSTSLEKQDPLFAVVGTRGRTLIATPAAQRELRLTPFELRRAQHGAYRSYRGEELRFLAKPIAPGRVLVVASSLRQREHALEGLATALAIGGPLALLLASAAAYWVASRAFSSVEEIRARAAAISHIAALERLPLERAPHEIRVLGETMNDMLDRVRASAEHERRFVTDASHELRTPLAILRSQLEIVQHDDVSRDELRAAVAAALDEVKQVGALADALLSLARADASADNAAVDLVRVKPLVEHVAQTFGDRAARQRRELVVDAADAYVLGDELALEQALANLVENALVHGSGTIRIRVEGTANIVRIRTSDEGPGFDDDFVERAFDRFSRARNAPRNGGAGLGLAIVAAIAERHGGRATVGDGAAGADVVLSLPAAKPPDATGP